MIGIYKITNINNGKVYIGQSNDVERRIWEHKKNRQMTIDDYINVLGVENFNFEILEECSKEELDEKEQQYIQYFNSNIKEKGYNIQAGGFNNSQGEGNGRARITEKEVEFIRKSYNEHKSAKEIFDTYFSDKISKSTFQSIWQGKSWGYIMPEVYTEENKKYYVSEQNKTKAILTKEEVLRYRKYYVDHTRDEVYALFLSEYGTGLLKRASFFKMLTGDVRKESIYLDVPVYKKSQKAWIDYRKTESCID